MSGPSARQIAPTSTRAMRRADSRFADIAHLPRCLRWRERRLALTDSALLAISGLKDYVEIPTGATGFPRKHLSAPLDSSGEWGSFFRRPVRREKRGSAPPDQPRADPD